MKPESVMKTNNITTTATISNLILYINPNLGFTLEYPSDWQKEERQKMMCDKCGIVIDGGPRRLREHKQEYHSY
jgi:hypothetical protein